MLADAARDAAASCCTDWPAFEAALKSAARAADLKLDAPLKKAILAALSERDETAAVCLDAKGNPEPDPELRDFENVPLSEDVDDYFEREVLPHVPDAWVDETQGQGRLRDQLQPLLLHYAPPRPLEEIEADIKALEMEIVDMLGEMTGSVET